MPCHKKEITIKNPCVICGKAKRMAHGRCSTCHSYFREHGVDRSPELIAKRAEISRRSRWCKVCGYPELEAGWRCGACAQYWRRHNRERPRHLWDSDCTCKTCKVPLETVRYKCCGYCQPCRQYLARTGKERPKEFWGIGSFGWCCCGWPAEHQIDEFNLCNRCIKDY